jgi:putative ABC transport system substrate-binding protein
MDRRAFFKTLSAIALAAPLSAAAQEGGKTPRIALVFANTPEEQMGGPRPTDRYARAFVEAMQELGWVDGQNITILRRSAEGRTERYLALAQELAALKVDLIVASAQIILPESVRRVTEAIPIVMIGAGDPVGLGLVKSLARPGGNITGLTSSVGRPLEEKRLQLLKEAVPRASRIAYLSDVAADLPEAAARALSVTLVPVFVSAPDQIPAAFATIARERPDAIFMRYGRLFWSHRRAIIEWAAKQRLPVMYPLDVFAQDGGLMSYGVSFTDLNRRAAGYADKILRGAKPGDLPVEQPTQFELIVNLKTAKALELTVARTLLLRADRVIE